jgi:hypothetical protein
MGKNRTHQDFVKEVETLTDGQYDVLSEFIKVNTKIILQHKKCKYKWEVQPRSFLSGSRCPKCNGKPLKDTNYFLEELKFHCNDEYELLDEYKNTFTHVRLRHVVCNEIWNVQPRSFLRGSRCPSCGNKGKALTQKEFINRINEFSYKLLSEYKNSKEKIDVIHIPCGMKRQISPTNLLKFRNCPTCKTNKTKEKKKIKFLDAMKNLGEDYKITKHYIDENNKIKIMHKCGYEYKINPSSIIKDGGDCPKCYGNYWDKEKFTKEIFSLVGDEYSLVSPFVNMTTKVTLLHNECGNHYNVTPSKFTSSSSQTRCNHCVGKRISKSSRMTNDEFLDTIKKVWKNEFEIMEEYMGTENKIKVKHQCGHIYKVKASHLMNGHGCPKCSGHYKDTQIFKKQIQELTNDEYMVLGEYTCANEDILMYHKKCKKEFLAKPTSLLTNKKRCPYCRETIGEEKIRHYLEKNNIEYKKQHYFSDCRNKRALRFDFAILQLDKVKCLIEFDGLQHNKKITYFGGEKGYQYTKKNDEIKNKYCIEKNIPLIRITYDQINNLDALLEHILGYFKVTDKQDIDESLVHKFLVNHPSWSHDQYIKQAK